MADADGDIGGDGVSTNKTQRKLKRSASMVERVADDLRRQIQTGALRPGQRIVQADIVERLGVSRGPVREALRRLAAEGLVDLKFNAGASVRLFSRDEVLAIEEAREAIEGQAAFLAAKRIDAAGRARELERLVAAMSRAAEEGAKQTFLELNDVFHDMILAIAANPVLRNFSDQLHFAIVQNQLEAFPDKSWMAEADAEHQAIAQAILDRDPTAAEAAMRAHLRRIRALTETLPARYFGPAD